MQKQEGVLNRGPTAVQGARDRTAEEMPRSLGQRERIWVIASQEIEYREGHKIPPYEPYALEAQYLNRVREMARRQMAQVLEYPRGVKPQVR